MSTWMARNRRRLVIFGIGVAAVALVGFNLLLLLDVDAAAQPRLIRVLLFEAAIAPLVLGGAALFRLIEAFAARQRAEKAIGHLAAIVESSDASMLSTDPQGTVLTWNPAAERMYGYPSSEAVGRDLADLIIPNDNLDSYREVLALVGQGQSIGRNEVVRRRRDGSLLYVSITVAPLLDVNGSIYGACSVARDMTEERRMAAELNASIVALAAAAEQARQSEARTRRFLDDAAHQIRSPITSIRACAETLTLGVTPDQRDRLLEAVCRESERAGRLMAGLLRLARLNTEQRLDLRSADVLGLCEHEAERARLDSPLTITASSVGAPFGSARLAAEAVGEILANLVENARRHARTRIDITARAEHHELELRVADDGPGLPETEVDTAFERFVSLDGCGGSGLGLAIARELARANGGDLRYADHAFVLRLPCELEPLGDDGRLSSPPAPAQRGG